MDKKIKTKLTSYAWWDFDKTAEDLNEMSQNGWQIIKFSAIYQKYEYNPNVVYRYQIDYTKKIDATRYYETFWAAGWEYIECEPSQWNLFRKAYNPQIPDSEYKIYTDEQSRVEMLKRCLFNAISLSLNALFYLLFSIHLVLADRYDTITYTAFIFFYLINIYGCVSALTGIIKIIRGKKKKHRFHYTLFILLMISAFLFLAVCQIHILYTT